MRNYEFIKDKLIEKHGTIDNYEYLDKYINTLITYQVSENIDYSEKHHILPKSTFPEYTNEEWNIIELDYEDHKLVHLWIFKAINTRSYQRPLNWMMNYYKNSEEISNAAKRGWVKLKSDKFKYQKWVDGKSKFMKKLSTDEQRRRANIFWDNITDIEYISFCNKIKEYWTDDRKMDKSNSMKEFYLKDGELEKKRIETQKRWDNMCVGKRKEFREKMCEINADEDKRKYAGLKIREMWSDPIYLEKMKKRKHRIVPKIQIIYPDNTVEILNSMNEVVREHNFSTHLIRKYRDKNITIQEKDLNDESISLLNCKIKTINI